MRVATYHLIECLKGMRVATYHLIECSRGMRVIIYHLIGVRSRNENCNM